MTPRDFFAITLKIIGLYLIIAAFVSIPQIAVSLYSYRYSAAEARFGELLEIGFFVLFAILFYIVFLYYCLFKTDWIIDKLQLDKGFAEEKFELNIHRSTILTISVIVIGAILITDSLPPLCRNIMTYFQTTTVHVNPQENIAVGWILFHFIKFFIGFFFASASRLVVNFIELKRKKPVSTD